MRYAILKHTLLLIFLSLFLLRPVFASTDEQKMNLEKQIKEYETKLEELKSQKNTLSAQIQYMDTQSYLAGLKINETENKIIQTEKEIQALGRKINGLNNSLDKLSESMLERIKIDYKSHTASLLDIVLDSTNASKLVNRLKYYDIARDSNQRILLQVQEAKSNFEKQKSLREAKIQELDKLKIQLDKQKTDLNNQQDAKKSLLATTQNDEVTYQNLLAKMKAEYAAIQGIVSGAGTETKLREVTKGESIASIIPGASCNSSGGHLHFIVKENDAVTDPFRFLKAVDNKNCSGSSCDSGDGDSFNPTGSWDWPLSPQINMNQGYGATWAVRNTYIGNIYNFHNGIDITGSSYTVSAVSEGTLYRGSYSGGGGCALPYMMLKHKDSNSTTLYLHVYSQ